MSGHILVDFDGTLAYHNPEALGLDPDPVVIPAMKNKIMKWLGQGVEVRIFTARACDPYLAQEVSDWTLKEFGHRLKVTNQKDFGTIEIWDDRAVRVKFNKGIVDNEFEG